MTDREELFKKISSEQSSRIRNICRHYTPSAENTDDLVQEVMINVWRNLDAFRGESSISTWIYRIAVNTSLSFLMKENRRCNFNLKLQPHHATELLYEDEKEVKIKYEQRANALQDAINRLNVIDKLLISLSMEKLSTREIADIIGITEPNVRTKLHRIREDLKTSLKGDHYE